MKVAVIQFEPLLFQMERNLALLVDLCRAACAKGAKLIVLPEMCTTGYCFADRDEIAPYVQAIPGHTTEVFGEIARLEKAYIVVGMAEVDPLTQVFYNSAVLIGPDGIVGRYRKTHSYVAETKWAKDGDMGIPVFDTQIGRIAIIICMDGVFFEASRVPALDGAEILAFPTNMFGRAPSTYWRARALENGMYFLAANRWGSERGTTFTGGSCIIDPEGAVVVSASQRDCDEIVMADVDIGKTRRDSIGTLGRRFSGRRPSLYHQILMDSYLWAPRQAFQLPSPRRSVVAAVQIPAGSASESRLREAVRLARDAQETRKCPDLLVLPEMFTSGGVMDLKAAELVPGPFTRFAANVARESGCLLVFGLLEKTDCGCYNTVVLVGPGGAIGKYRKTHLSPKEEGLVEPGDLGFPVFDTELGRIGLLAGSEMVFPEAVRCLAKQAVDILCVPASLEDEDLRWLWFERAKTNSINLVVANYCSDPETRFCGRSSAYGYLETEGEEVMSELGRDEVGSASLAIDTNPQSFCRVKESLRKLRPHLYDTIVTQRR